MDWVKEIGPKAGGSGGWSDDLPLDHELPDLLGLDCSHLEMPIHPMFAVRLRVFIDWHRREGRGVPVTQMREFSEVEEIAERTQELLEYQLPDVSALGQATFMAVSELCNNAVEHGSNTLGAYAAVRRVTDPRSQMSIAISDLGMGIPEHIRQCYPEWSDDGWAIAHATQEGVSGTGDSHRGIGFSAVMEAALTSSLHAARMDILSANGFCRLQSVQESPKVEVFPAARFRRGTWISAISLRSRGSRKDPRNSPSR